MLTLVDTEGCYWTLSKDKIIAIQYKAPVMWIYTTQQDFRIQLPPFFDHSKFLVLLSE